LLETLTRLVAPVGGHGIFPEIECRFALLFALGLRRDVLAKILGIGRADLAEQELNQRPRPNVELECLGLRLQGRIAVAACPSGCKIFPDRRVGVVRSPLECGCKGVGGLGVLALIEQDSTLRFVAVVRVEGNRGVAILQGAVVLAEVRVCDASVLEDERVLRLQADGGVVVRDRAAVLTQAIISIGALVERIGESRR
jgi:hypothetical protein